MIGERKIKIVRLGGGEKNAPVATPRQGIRGRERKVCERSEREGGLDREW